MRLGQAYFRALPKDFAGRGEDNSQVALKSKSRDSVTRKHARSTLQRCGCEWPRLN